MEALQLIRPDLTSLVKTYCLFTQATGANEDLGVLESLADWLLKAGHGPYDPLKPVHFQAFVARCIQDGWQDDAIRTIIPTLTEFQGYLEMHGWLEAAEQAVAPKAPLLRVLKNPTTPAPVEGVSQAPDHVRIWTYWDEWKIKRVREDYADKETMEKDYEPGIRFLADYLNERKERLNQEILFDFADHLDNLLKPNGDPYAPKSLNKWKNGIRPFLRFCAIRGYFPGIDPDAMLRVKKSDDRALKPHKALKYEEYTRFQAAMARFPLRDQAIATVLMVGPRVTEVSRLKAEAYNPAKETLDIHGPLKGGEVHAIPLQPEDAAILRRWIEEMNLNEDDWLFPGQKPGKPITQSTIRKRLQAIKDAAGIRRKVTPHDFRHTFALHTYYLTKDALVVKRVLGHRHLETTMNYLQGVDGSWAEALRERNKRLAELNEE